MLNEMQYLRVPQHVYGHEQFDLFGRTQPITIIVRGPEYPDLFDDFTPTYIEVPVRCMGCSFPLSEDAARRKFFLEDNIDLDAGMAICCDCEDDYLHIWQARKNLRIEPRKFPKHRDWCWYLHNTDRKFIPPTTIFMLGEQRTVYHCEMCG